MKAVSIRETKQRIEYLVEQASQDDEVYYLTHQRQAKAVMVSVEHYEALLRRVEQLEGELARVWAAVETEQGRAPADLAREPIMLPTPDGGWRPFHPGKVVSPQARAVLQQAARLARERRGWPLERTIDEGRQAIERARQEAIVRGTAIDHEREAAFDD